MPPIPEGVEDGILRGLYLYQPAPESDGHRVQIFGSGTALMAAVEAQKLLADNHNVAADVWSVTSYQLLRNDALEVERWNRLHPDSPPHVSYIAETLRDRPGPVIAVTDYMKAIPEQVSRFLPHRFVPLGTDGFGRSDTRASLRRHFEIDGPSITVATLHGLALDGTVGQHEASAALELYGLPTELADPRVR
jgi:pyruvate dehydrogenase E1 component